MKKNVILIMTDEHRYDSMSCVGNDIVHTPNMDALASSGNLFENCHCASPLCVPSRVSLFTGQYVHRNMATSNLDSAHISLEQTSLVEILKRNGYATGLAGKNHAFNNQYIHKWFDYREEYSHFGKTHGQITDDDKKVIDYYRTRRKEGLIDGPAPFTPQQLMSGRIAEDGIEFVRQNKESPFFLFYSFPDPHWPNIVCEPYYSMYSESNIDQLECTDIDWRGHPFKHFVQSQVNGFDKYTDQQRKRILATYYGQLSYIDNSIGKLLSYLDQNGLRDDTVIIFNADHGNFAGRYGLIGKTGGFCDALVRIPCIMNFPDIKHNRTISAQVSNIDIMPTILDYLGIDIPTQVQGKSIMNVLSGETDTHRTELYAEVGSPIMPPKPFAHENFAEHNQNMIDNKKPRWFCDYSMNGRSAMIKKDEWKYCYNAGDCEELYHLPSDPFEINNLANLSEHGQIKNQLKNQLMEWLLTAPFENI